MKSKNKKLLILAWGVYPNTGGSTIIINNISEGFTKEELVLAGEVPSFKPDKEWSSISEIPLNYLNPFPLGYRRPARYIRWLMVNTMIRQVKQIVKDHQVYRILTVFPDEYYCFIAMKVAEDLALPFDIWFHNSYLENRSGILKRLAERLQPQFFNKANRIFAMSDGLRKEMKKIYPDINFQTLTHGFKQFKPEKIDLKLDKKKVKFLYSGSLNHSCLDASLRVMKVIKSNPSYELHIYSGNPSYIESLGITGKNVFNHAFLPVDEFTARLKNYDIMLLPHGIDGLRSDFEFKTIFPTRTIPLLCSGKPILAHCPKQSFLTDFLEEHKCAELVTEKSDEKIERAIENLVNNEASRKELVDNALRASEIFELSNVVNKIKNS